MKKLFVLIAFLLVSLNVYPFWIWSPKTNKWKNPDYAAQVNPYLQYREALKFFEEAKFQAAHKSFRKIIINYPDAFEAAEAQFFLGRCLEEMKKPYDAFLEYKKVLESYPNSKRINEVLERQYKIAEYFLDKDAKKWLGVSVYDFVEHPAIEILRVIIEKAPYSQYSSSSQYKLGLLFMRLGRYEEAKEEFQKVLDNYPDSEWAVSAKYQLAVAVGRGFSGADYDASSISQATEELDDFIKKNPDSQIVDSAHKQLVDLKEKEAKKNFDIAQFYAQQKKYSSARLYYQIVIDEYPMSSYASLAEKKLKELEVE